MAFLTEAKVTQNKCILWFSLLVDHDFSLPYSLRLFLFVIGCEFHCSDGWCLWPDWVCDGFEDCSDASDEGNCTDDEISES